MRSGIIFIIVLNVMIFSQIFLQANNRNKKLKDIEDKLNSILVKLK